MHVKMHPKSKQIIVHVTVIIVDRVLQWWSRIRDQLKLETWEVERTWKEYFESQ